MKYISTIIFTTILSVGFYHFSHAQQAASADPFENLEKTILYHDSIFWFAYNACDVDKMSSYFTEDLEFYHDKNGVTSPRVKMDEAMQKGLCGNENWHLRREAIKGTVKVFPMKGFGALISGEHVFYINETGKKEYLDGYGKFTHLWKYADGVWRMSRVISYDHGPPPFINKRKEVTLNDEELSRFSGNYKSSRGQIATVTALKNSLTITMGNFQIQMIPESKMKFFARDRDLQIDFVLQEDKAKRLLVYEKGNVVDELVRQ
jgi:Domain of unknown function (DUF4440)